MRLAIPAVLAVAVALAAGEAAAQGPVTAAKPAAVVTPAAAARQDTTPAALVVQQAWVRATPPGATVAAAYVTVRNPGTRAIVVVGVRSPVAARASIHETRMSGGSMQMRAKPELAVPAGATVVMEPAGVHVMLEDLSRPLAAGQAVSLELLLAGGGSVPVSAVVRPLGAG